ncbi:hypothetical protein Taro_049556 [Colocasia esculenta]|uniref:Embryo defective protein n=1 Tax=Colocasia esculenta TaxID=4460 RepID=A0A843XB72_COLES|nr:hypothetical protein [Colocasia esculenta]
MDSGLSTLPPPPPREQTRRPSFRPFQSVSPSRLRSAAGFGSSTSCTIEPSSGLLPPSIGGARSNRRNPEPWRAPKPTIPPAAGDYESAGGRGWRSSSPFSDIRGPDGIMKLKVVCRKLYDYVRHDLKEIAFPSSLPDPPHIKKRRKLTWKERYYVLKEASRLYAASWVGDIGPELRPNDYKQKVQGETKPNGENAAFDKGEPSTLEDLAVAARGGMETLKPALQRLYMTRASAYRDALKSFIQGYQEGLQQVMEGKGGSKGDSNPEPQNDVGKKTTGASK